MERKEDGGKEKPGFTSNDIKRAGEESEEGREEKESTATDSRERCRDRR